MLIAQAPANAHQIKMLLLSMLVTLGLLAVLGLKPYGPCGTCGAPAFLQQAAEVPCNLCMVLPESRPCTSCSPLLRDPGPTGVLGRGPCTEC